MRLDSKFNKGTLEEEVKLFRKENLIFKSQKAVKGDKLKAVKKKFKKKTQKTRL